MIFISGCLLVHRVLCFQNPSKLSKVSSLKIIILIWSFHGFKISVFIFFQSWFIAWICVSKFPWKEPSKSQVSNFWADFGSGLGRPRPASRSTETTVGRVLCFWSVTGQRSEIWPLCFLGRPRPVLGRPRTSRWQLFAIYMRSFLCQKSGIFNPSLRGFEAYQKGKEPRDEGDD